MTTRDPVIWWLIALILLCVVFLVALLPHDATQPPAYERPRPTLNPPSH